MTNKQAMLGPRLKAAREYVGLSQQEVADAIDGLSRSAISMIESGRRRVTVEELTLLAELYGRRLTEFTDVDDVPKLPKEANFVARQMTKLSPQDRAEVVRFTKLLLSRRGSADHESS